MYKNIIISIICAFSVIGMLSGLLLFDRHMSSQKYINYVAQIREEQKKVKDDYENQINWMQHTFKLELDSKAAENFNITKERDALLTEVGELKELITSTVTSGKLVTYDITLSHYTASVDETDSRPWETATGTRPVVGRTLALSRDLFQHLRGRKVYVRGIGIFTVEDTMNARYSRRGDLLVSSKSEAKKLGVKTNIKLVVLPENLM
jgi:3D (Asp-Asp-Asp) domain-containing protein